MKAPVADPLVIDWDVTLVATNSEKEQATGNYKGGFGFAPFTARLDYAAGRGTGKELAVLMRHGGATANKAEDHIRILEATTAILPDSLYGGNGERVPVRTDSAGASRKFAQPPPTNEQEETPTGSVKSAPRPASQGRK